MNKVIKCRETTNQKLLSFYEKMYDDLKPVSPLKEKAMEVIERTLNNATLETDEKELLPALFDIVRHLEG